MDYLFYIVTAALLLVAIGLLAAVWKRLKAAASPVEGELRGRIAGLEGEAEALRSQLAKASEARTQAETRLEAERANLAEQRRLLEEAEARLKDAFKALSSDALADSRREFLSQAQERLRPIQDLLGEYQKRLTEVEKAREGAYGGLREYLDALNQAQEGLRKETHQLSSALRSSPTARGRWGEVTLRRVVEVAGMSRYCDFDEQAAVRGEEGALRPDMTVRLPNERLIVVDSKAPLSAYLEACEAPDDGARTGLLQKHARDIRQHMKRLGEKAYWNQFPAAPDFVVLFLPGESFFSAALEQDRTLIEDGMKSGVVLATPTTLIALLRAVAYGWQQQEMAENAERIADAGRDLYDRIRVFAEKLRDVGSGLRSAAKAYDAAVGSYESRLEPGARKLAELGAASGRDLPEVAPAEGPTRALPAPDAQG